MDWEKEAADAGIAIVASARTLCGNTIVLGKMPRAWDEWGVWTVYECGLSSGSYFTSIEAAEDEYEFRFGIGY